MGVELVMTIFKTDIGIDMGTTNTIIYLKNKGIILKEPSVVAFNEKNRKILATGKEADQMIGRTPKNIKAVRPLRNGVIADFEITEKMLKQFIDKIKKKIRFFRPRIIICIPSGITEINKKSVLNAAMKAGAREVYLIRQSMAAAMGAGLPVQESVGNMIVDIGGGNTEVAVISLGGIVESEVIRTGGREMDKKIIQIIKNKHNLAIGEKTAGNIKKEIGTVSSGNHNDSKNIRGINVINGLPKTINIESKEIMEALQIPLQKIIDAVILVLENTPPELTADIINKHIVLTGGGGLLSGMEERLEKEIGISVKLAEKPLISVVKGTGIALKEIKTIKENLIS